MNLWLDAQLPPRLSPWLRERFGVSACHLVDLALQEAEDLDVFWRARDADAVLMTKDRDFVELVKRHGPPPRVLWVTCGNKSNQELQGILDDSLGSAFELLSGGEALVEISEAR